MPQKKSKESDRAIFKQALALMETDDGNAVRELLSTNPLEVQQLRDLLDWAAEYGYMSSMEAMLQVGTPLEESTAVASAASEGQIEAMRWLLERGAPVNRINRGKVECIGLEFAAKFGHLEAAQLLVEHGAHVDPKVLKVATPEVRAYLETVKADTSVQSGGAASAGRPAIKLPGEAEFLAAVVNDLANDAPRKAYARWLTSQDDPRGEFLKSFLAEPQGVDLDEYDHDDDFPPGWVRIVGCPQIQDIAEFNLTKRKKAILKLARPVAYLVETESSDDEVPVGASKLGGLPDLAPGVAWPRGVDCTSSYQQPTKSEGLCGFLGQIRLADLVGLTVGRDLPKEGQLSFFGYYDFASGEDGIRVLYQTDVSQLQRTKPGGPLNEANEIRPAIALAFEEGLDIPADDGPWRDDLKLPEENTYSYMLREYGTALLGYFHGTSGEDVTPDKNWRHLISLRPHVQFHFQIHADDLAARNFDKVSLVWIDYN